MSCDFSDDIIQYIYIAVDPSFGFSYVAVSVRRSKKQSKEDFRNGILSNASSYLVWNGYAPK